MTTTQVAYWNLQEQKRTNRANESIKSRTNDIGEGKLQVDTENMRVNQRNADINAVNAETNRVKVVTDFIGKLGSSVIGGLL